MIMWNDNLGFTYLRQLHSLYYGIKKELKNVEMLSVPRASCTFFNKLKALWLACLNELATFPDTRFRTFTSFPVTLKVVPQDAMEPFAIENILWGKEAGEHRTRCSGKVSQVIMSRGVTLRLTNKFLNELRFVAHSSSNWLTFRLILHKQWMHKLAHGEINTFVWSVIANEWNDCSRKEFLFNHNISSHIY